MSSPTAGRVSALAAAFAAAIALAGCAPYHGTTAQKVQQWAKQDNFVTNNNQLLDDIQRLRDAVRIGTPLQLNTICGGFASDVGTAYTTLPAPDEELTTDLNKADELFLGASTTCDHVGAVNSVGTTRALAEIAAGVSDLAKSQQLLKSLGVTWKAKL